MGYHHCHVPPLKDLQKTFQHIGLEMFVKQYIKYESLIGDADSINFIESKIFEALNLKKSK